MENILLDSLFKVPPKEPPKKGLTRHYFFLAFAVTEFNQMSDELVKKYVLDYFGLSCLPFVELEVRDRYIFYKLWVDMC